MNNRLDLATLVQMNELQAEKESKFLVLGCALLHVDTKGSIHDRRSGPLKCTFLSPYHLTGDTK